MRSKCGCKASFNRDHPRIKMWTEALGPSPSVPIKHPVPHLVEGKRYFKADVSRIDEATLTEIIEALAGEFDINPFRIRNEVEKSGFIPVRDENLTLIICNLHYRCML